jgi:hypothetical protein
MLRRIFVGICACVALCGAGAAASTASAEPVFLTKAVVGEAAPSSVPFTGTIAVTFWEGAASKAKVSCTAGTVGGEVTGAQTLAKIGITLTGCETSGCKVHSKGLPEGEVVSQTLAGKLNGITATLPGVKLFSEAEGKGGVFLEAEVCGGVVKFVLTGEVTGSLSGAVGEGPSTGKLASAMKLTFAQKAGIQKYQGFSEGGEAGLMGQLTDTVNLTPELAGLSAIVMNKTVPSTFGLGVTK